MKKKYYAVRKGKTTGIFETWDACKDAINGYSGAEYKSFTTLEAAQEYINNSVYFMDSSSVSDDISVSSDDSVIAYIDGSYKEDLQRYSFGCVIITKNGTFQEYGYGDEPEALLIRNIAGEMQGAIYAAAWAKKNNYKNLEIRYDYEGIEKWVIGVWKAKNTFTKIYVERMNTLMRSINISFKKIAAHSGNKYNDMADALAKRGLVSGTRKPQVKQGDFWYSVDGITYEDITTIIKLIMEEDFPELSLTQKDINGGKLIELSVSKERVVLSSYPTKLLMQGKLESLFSLIVTYICELVDVKVSELYHTTFNMSETEEHIEEQYMFYLPNSHQEFKNKIKKVLLQAICNLHLTDIKYDASFITQPIFRVIEAHLKNILVTYGIAENFQNHKNFDMFEKQNTRYILKPDSYGTATQSMVKYIEDVYNFYNSNRHPLFHWDDPTAPIDTTRIMHVSEAHNRIKTGLEIIDKYYTLS